MAINYTVTAFSQSKKGGGQVTVTVGEGRNRRSFTRHVNQSMVGLNIDPRAIPLNEKYEQELAEAQDNLTIVETELKKLHEKLARVEAETPETIVDAFMLKEMKAELEAAIGSTQASVSFADVELRDAETKLDIVRQ